MRLVTDFDGVWTLPDDEAEAQGAWMDRTLAEWAGAPGVAAWIAAARAAIAAEPARYGWAPGGRISAYGDEDPFAAHSAFLHYLHLHSGNDSHAAAIVRALEKHGFELDAFGGHAHAQGVDEVARTRGPGILPEAARAGHRMLDAGIDVVVVSNSGTAKLARWFEHAGLPATVHPERRSGALVLRGAARKFALDPDARSPLTLAGVEFETARPSYHSVLQDERPDAVVGDVFSLDLALPLVLRRTAPGFEAMRLFWLLRSYTPARIRSAVESAAPEVEILDGGLESVADLLTAAPQGRS